MVQQDLAREEEYSAAVICLEAAGNRKLRTVYYVERAI